MSRVRIIEDEEIRDLCLRLVKSDTEDEVVNLLRQFELWDDDSLWINYGSIPNNYSIIGNQQSSSDAALVEKLVNSVDAILMKECNLRSIDPKSASAPKNSQEALKIFFDIDGGSLANIGKQTRKELSNLIQLVVTGSRDNPCYSIVDKGEGQNPKNFSETFLSLVSENKLDIPFVQGRFGMGSTGVLPFCGEKQIQLIVSKRNPEMNKQDEDTDSKKWGFTIIRRFDPEGNMKNSVYRYLAPSNKILSFESESLPVLPGNYPKAYSEPLKYGTLVKLFNYQLPKKLKGISVLNLYFHLSLLLPAIPLPIKICERRNFKDEGLDTILNGLTIRLEDNKYKDIEEGYPTSDEILINNQRFIVKIFALKSNTKDYTRSRYTGNGKKSVIFSFNGQAHGFFPKNFFERKKVDKSYLSDSIVVLVDCSDIDRRTYECLFMNSRDRLFDTDTRRNLEKQLEIVIGKHPGLMELTNKRRLEAIKNKVLDNRTLVEIVETVIAKSPVLSRLFIQGKRIQNPFNLAKVGISVEYKGKQYPTYFLTKKQHPPKKPKRAMRNHDFRIEFETDAANDYFVRENFPGIFRMFAFNDNKQINFDYHLHLWNGKAVLRINLPAELELNSVWRFKTEVEDIKHINKFEDEFYVKIIEDKTIFTESGKSLGQPPGDSGVSKREKPTKLDLPQIFEVHNDEWVKYNFDKESVLLVRGTGEGIGEYDFFINMDNACLLSEIKTNPKKHASVYQEQYKVGMFLIGVSILNNYSKDASSKHDDVEEVSEEHSIFDLISDLTRSIAPVLLPMISTLGSLNE